MSRDYFNRMAANWDETIAEKDATKLQQLADSMDILAGACVLDVGTGTGVLIPYLLAKVGENGRLVAMDFAEEMLKKARAKGFKGNIEYLQADISGVPLPAATFDAVVCYSAFPHFPDKPLALREINRLLKASGRLFIGHTSSRAAINQIHSHIPTLTGDLLPERDEMLRLLSGAGFASVTIQDSSERYLVRAVKKA